MAHTHDIIDAGNHFVIDPLLRTITSTNPESVLVQGDHNSERYTFELPRVIEGHDMTLCNRIEIHYDNISRNKKEMSEGVYIVNDSNAVDDKVVFSWIISCNATRLAGTMQFWISFRCVDENDNIIYSWGTNTFKSVRVVTGKFNTDAVIADFPDVLEQWKKEVIEDIELPDEKVSTAISEYLDKNPMSSATIGVVELFADKWVSNENLHYQIVDIDGVTENSQVDLTPSVEQLMIFYEKDLTFVTENDGGVVIVYAIGQKPTNDYVMQVTITEVFV